MSETLQEWKEAAPELTEKVITYLKETWNKSLEELVESIDEDEAFKILSSDSLDEAYRKIDDVASGRSRRRKSMFMY
jgi:uncharacterized protein YdhG (YjbR/CyaY superfamily)